MPKGPRPLGRVLMYFALNTRNANARTTKNAVAAIVNRFIDTGTIFLSPTTMMPPEQAERTIQALFTEVPRETVRKGVLGRWLGTLPSMLRRAYPTDLSDVEWACLEPYLPTHATRSTAVRYLPSLT